MLQGGIRELPTRFIKWAAELHLPWFHQTGLPHIGKGVSLHLDSWKCCSGCRAGQWDHHVCETPLCFSAAPGFRCSWHWCGARCWSSSVRGAVFWWAGIYRWRGRSEISLWYCGISGKQHKREIILHCTGQTSSHTVVVLTVIWDAENTDTLQKTDIQLNHLMQPKKEEFSSV